MKSKNKKVKLNNQGKLIFFHIFCFMTIVAALICIFVTNKKSVNIIYQYNHRMTNTDGKKDMYYYQQYSRKVVANKNYIKKSNLELDVRADKNGKLFLFHDNDFSKRKATNLTVWDFDIKDEKKFDVMNLKDWVNNYGSIINKAMVEFKFDPRFNQDKKFMRKEQRQLALLLRPIKDKVIVNSFIIDDLKYFRDQGYKVYLDIGYDGLMDHFSEYNNKLDGIFLNVEKLHLTKSGASVVSKDPDFNKFKKVWKKGLFLWNVKEGDISKPSNRFDSEYLATKFLVNNMSEFRPLGTIINKAILAFEFNEIVKENGMDYIDGLNVSKQRKRQILMDFLFGKNHEYYKNNDSFDKWKSDVLQRIK